MKVKVTVSVDEGLLGELDEQVQQQRFSSRSAAMEGAILALLGNQAEVAYERALEALTDEDAVEMQALAEEGLGDFAEIVGGEGAW